MWEYKNTNELYHHGILGMKWGVRRYQYKDGSLTPAGKKRADKLKTQYTELTGKRLIRKPATKTTNENQNKSIRDMSDTELVNKINRLQREKQLISLEAERKTTGQKFVNSVTKDVIAPSAIEAGKRVLTNLFTKVGTKALGLDKTETDAFETLKKEAKTAQLKKQLKQDTDWLNNYESNKKAKENKNEFVTNKVKTNNTTNKKKDDIIDVTLWNEPNTSVSVVPYRNMGEEEIRKLFK